MTISVSILSLNEKDHIGLAIGSVIDLVDEVMVLDGGSTDGTLDLLAELGPKVKVHVQPQSGNPYTADWQQEARRQRLEELCTSDWVMQLDADEVISDTFATILPTLLAEAPAETLCFGVNRLDYCPDLYHGYLPYTAHHTIPRIWRRGAISWLTGKALHMAPNRSGTKKEISSFAAPVFVRTPLVLHHLHRASWIGKSREKRRFEEQGQRPFSRAHRLGTYKFEMDFLPQDIIPMSLRQLRAHQKRVLMQELGVEDDFLKVDTANLAVDSQGFFLPSNLQGLKNLISDLPHPLLFVEIGSWLGSSTRFLAQQTGGCVIAIDPWTGSAEHQKGEFRGMLPLLQQQFLRNCYAYRERILPIQRTSEDALALPIKDIDLLYIDGAHDYASVLADLRNWTPRLAPYGIVCGDDWNWGNEKPVRRAVVDFAKKAEKLVQSEGNFWWLA